MIEQFKRKALLFPRMRSRPRKFMGEFYWETIPEEELNKVINNMFIDIKDE